MKILSFDQATLLTGYAVFDDHSYVESGVITKSKSINIAERIPSMALAICAKIKEHRPDVCIIEDVQTQSNQKTVIDLARLQGGIIMYCKSKSIPIKILHPSEWRRLLGFAQGNKVGREELKQQAVNYVEELGLNISSQDECEAICINVAAQKIF